MREIKFRGLRTDGKGWVYGYYHKNYNKECFIIKISETGIMLPGVKVLPESIGQFTGLKDKNGIEIYEGDEITSFKKEYEDNPSENIVFFIRGCFYLQSIGKNDIPIYNYNSSHLEITGNIHEKK